MKKLLPVYVLSVLVLMMPSISIAAHGIIENMSVQSQLNIWQTESGVTKGHASYMIIADNDKNDDYNKERLKRLEEQE